ncbi:hypothetical protein [uncultured Lamprocystis sp.]|uniref:hypothetical protein n=1 Tax=uncultured Lamprocystis sp. TaxID=543132 RepID=UPI0025DD9ACB|nr:hypothetical protein [uncultured Lamprocystis sp.]
MILETKHSVRGGVVGPGDVGPRRLAVAFGKRCATVGFDINGARIADRIASRNSA